MRNIIVATLKPWDIKNFLKIQENFKEYSFHLFTKKEDLNPQKIKELNPKFIFFTHWSYYISKELYEKYECVSFHIGDLPFGRGGSPLQNLIIRKIYKTKISAFKTDKELDSGDIYLKEDFNLSFGSAKKLFKKASKIIFLSMIPRILRGDFSLEKQRGKSLVFERRKEEQSEIAKLDEKNLQKLYDFIRMLDAKGYPRAFLRLENIKIEFKKARLKDNKLIGRFELYEEENFNSSSTP